MVNLLAVTFIMQVVMVISVITAIFLILLVLVQKGRGGGLSGAFGGGAAGSLMGSKTGDFLTWLTVAVAAFFLFLMVVMAKFYRPEQPQYGGEPVVQPPTSTQPAEQPPVQPQEQPSQEPIGEVDTGTADEPELPVQDGPAVEQ